MSIQKIEKFFDNIANYAGDSLFTQLCIMVAIFIILGITIVLLILFPIATIAGLLVVSFGWLIYIGLKGDKKNESKRFTKRYS